MGKVLAIDFGAKRIGIAETDELQIIASGLTTVDNKKIWEFLEKHFSNNQIDEVVVGLPKNLKNEATHGTELVTKFAATFKTKYPEIPFHLIDERFTSKMAFQAMIDGGLKKKQRANKAKIDEVSATIILQSYLEQKSKR